MVLDWFCYNCNKSGTVLSNAKRLLYGVPQGSVVGPMLFSLCTTDISQVTHIQPGINFHFYADDKQLYVHLTHKNVAQTFDRLRNCLDNIKKWLTANKLKLNPDKTEFILLGSRTVCSKFNEIFPVNIIGNLVSPVEVVRNLGV